jgi:transcription elongation GreA/GreB family factor
VAQLWRLAPNAPWLAEMICGLGDRAVGWQRQDLFVRLTDHLAGKLVPPWFAATATAVGMDRFVELGVELPLRLWTALERQVIETDGAPERLVGEVLTRVEEAQTSADMLLWLWKSERPERDGMAVPVLVFRTLARPVRGSFIKAAKELRKLLNDSPDFQRFMMHGGDPDAVTELVRCIRQLPLLDTGEQQSLLVKIVRLYPEAKPLVEQRRTVVTRRPVDKVTSVRSFELRRRELHQIVSVKVPANSRAIAHARGYGDLRENAEYKAAKDEQRYLNARRRELERGLNEVRSMDFGLISVADRIVPGCSVVMAYPDGRREEFHVLGLWDSIPDRRMISYDTPLGRLLLGRQVGESVAVPSGQEAKVAGIRGLSQDLLVWLRGDDLEPEKA